MKSWIRFLGGLLFIFSFSNASAQDPRGVGASQKFKKVVWIVFENETYGTVLQQKDFAHFATMGASLNKMMAENHPSQGNYIAMVAGSTLGVNSDKNVNLKDSHVGDLLEKAGMDWRVYAENYPGNCFTGSSNGNYARKHVPFMSFTNVTGDSARCAKIEDESRFFSDFAAGTLPEFTMYIPNLKNDGHDTNPDFAGQWLTSKFGTILDHPEKLGDVLFILTWDESAMFASKNQIYTVLIGANVVPGSQNSQTLNHPALLKMVEDELGLGNLGRLDASAPVITGIWK
jgi:hypothetical protein